MITSLLLSLLFMSTGPVDPVRPDTPRHREPVVGLALSPEGKQVASLSRDGVLFVWNAKTQKAVFEMTTPRLAVAVRWLQPTKLITVGSMGLANVDAVAGKLLTVKRIGQRTDAGAISPDGRFAAVGNTHFVGQLINVETGASLMPYPAPSEWSYAMDVSSDSSLLAIGGRNPDPDSITLLETKNFKAVRHWPTQLKHAFGLRFSPNGKLLCSVGDANVVNVWNVAHGTLMHSLPLAQPGAVAVCFSDDSQYLAACCGVPVNQLGPNHFDVNPGDRSTVDKPTTSFVQVWNLETKLEVWRSESLKSWATSMIFIGNDCLVTGHQDGEVRFWRVGK